MAETKSKRYTGPVSLGSVAPEPDEQITRASVVDLSEYTKVLQTSMDSAGDNGKGAIMGITLIAEAVPSAISRFRNAGRRFPNGGIGVGFQTITHTDPKAVKWGLVAGQVRLLVQAKPRKAANGTAAAKKAAGTVPAPQGKGLPAPPKRK